MKRNRPQVFICIALALVLPLLSLWMKEGNSLTVADALSRRATLDGKEIRVKAWLFSDGTDGLVLKDDATDRRGGEILFLDLDKFHDSENPVFCDLALNGRVDVVIKGRFRKSGFEVRGLLTEGVAFIEVSDIEKVNSPISVPKGTDLRRIWTSGILSKWSQS